MRGLDMNNLFKALLIIILGAFLYLYYENSNSGRYVSYGGGGVLDTKTGKSYIYTPHNNKIILYDLPNATRKERDVKEQ